MLVVIGTAAEQPQRDDAEEQACDDMFVSCLQCLVFNVLLFSLPVVDRVVLASAVGPRPHADIRHGQHVDFFIHEIDIYCP